MLYKVVPAGHLVDVLRGMEGCCTLLQCLSEHASQRDTPPSALWAVAELLERICEEFQTDIDNAEVEDR